MTLKDFDKNEDGTYTYEFKDLTPGDYTVKETQPNIPGYEVEITYGVDEDATESKAEVKPDDTVIVKITDEYTETEEEYGKLVIKKTFTGRTDLLTDDFKDKIEFDIIYPNGKTETIKYAAFSNKKKGEHVIPKLVPGNYKVVEKVKTAEHDLMWRTTTYVVSSKKTTDKAEAEVTVNGTATVEITNDYLPDEHGNFKKHPSVKIFKRDKSTKKRLAGAEFTLYDAQNKAVKVWVSPSSADFFDIGEYLKPGQTYTFKETKAPQGYKLLDETITLTVSVTGIVTIQGKEINRITIDDAKSSGGGGNGGNGGGGGGSTYTTGRDRTNGAKTGDTSNATGAAAAGALALLAIVLILMNEKKRRKMNKN